LSARHDSPRHGTEQGVSDREPPEEDSEHRSRRFAVGTQQRRQVLLPGHLVDQAAEAGGYGQEQRDSSDHRWEPACLRIRLEHGGRAEARDRSRLDPVVGCKDNPDETRSFTAPSRRRPFRGVPSVVALGAEDQRRSAST
jgi:hypothetical protein